MATFQSLALSGLGRGLLSPVPGEVLSDAGMAAVLHALPGGRQVFWGVPFRLAPGRRARRWAWFGRGTGRGGGRLRLAGRADHVVVAHFCAPALTAGRSDHEWVRVIPAGEEVARYTLRYADGGEAATTLRRRFEINDVEVAWGQLAFSARQHRAPRAVDPRGTVPAASWGLAQMGVELPDYYGLRIEALHRRPIGDYWLYALPVERAVELRAL